MGARGRGGGAGVKQMGRGVLTWKATGVGSSWGDFRMELRPKGVLLLVQVECAHFMGIL